MKSALSFSAAIIFKLTRLTVDEFFDLIGRDVKAASI